MEVAAEQADCRIGRHHGAPAYADPGRLEASAGDQQLGRDVAVEEAGEAQPGGRVELVGRAEAAPELGGAGEGGWSPENESLAAMIVLQPQGQQCTSSQRLSKENAVHST